MNYSRRHSYYTKKTINWLVSLGYAAEKVEYVGMVGQHYTKRDLWGADIIYRNAESLGFIQVKTSDGQIAKGKRQLACDTNWPVWVGRHVVMWEPRSKSPTVEEVSVGCRIA